MPLELKASGVFAIPELHSIILDYLLVLQPTETKVHIHIHNLRKVHVSRILRYAPDWPNVPCYDGNSFIIRRILIQLGL